MSYRVKSHVRGLANKDLWRFNVSTGKYLHGVAMGQFIVFSGPESVELIKSS